MKQLVCEMCGSTDLIKQEGVFICQSCGVKYSVEEAKKMMIEGAVEVQGTVKIDTSEEVVNWHQIARRAKENDDSETAAKYYGLISEKEPSNWEAYFYSVYFEESNCRLIEMTAACDRVSKCAYTALQLIKEHIANRDEQILAALEVAEKAVDFADTVYDTAITNYKQRNDDAMLNHCLTATVMPLKMGEALKAVFGEYQELHNMIAAVWKDGVDLIITMCKDSFPLDGMIKIAREHADKIKEYDTSYVTPAYLLQQSTTKTTAPQQVPTYQKAETADKKRMYCLWGIGALLLVCFMVCMIISRNDNYYMFEFVSIGCLVSSMCCFFFAPFFVIPTPQKYVITENTTDIEKQQINQEIENRRKTKTSIYYILILVAIYIPLCILWNQVLHNNIFVAIVLLGIVAFVFYKLKQQRN